MVTFFYSLMVGIVIIMIAMLFRVFKGPSAFDRLNGLSVLSINTILLLILIGYVDKRPDMFVDISVAYAILGFIGSVVIAKYVIGKEINR